MTNTFKILFYGRKSKINADLQLPVYMRVTLDSQRYEFSTGFYVTEKEWINASSKNPKMPKAIELTKLMDAHKIKASDIQRKLILTGQPYTIQDFQSEWEQKKVYSKSLLKVFLQHNADIEKLIGKEYSLATLKRFRTSYDHLEKFISDKYDTSDWPIDKVNYHFITDFEFWLKVKKNLIHSSAMKYIAALKKIVLICYKNNWIDSPSLCFL